MGKGRYNHTTHSAMVQQSMFLTLDQFNDHLHAHMQLHYHQLTPSARKVCTLLSRYAASIFGVAYRKIGEIAKEIEVSDATVKRALRLLERLGIIKRVSMTRPKKGGDGANLYAFLPCHDPAPMTLRDEAETPTAPTGEANNFQNETKYSLKHKKIDKDTNVKEDRPAAHKLDKSFWDFVPRNVPEEFVRAVKPAFPNGKTIFSMWGKVLHYAKTHGCQLDNMLPMALDAWHSTKQAYKRDKSRKDWSEDRFFGYFYGAIKKIDELRIEELCAIWRD